MNLVAHIFKKDLRRLWPHLLLIVAAAVVAYLVGLQIRPKIGEGGNFVGTDRSELFIPCWLFWVSLFPAIIQADPPFGSRAFWMTRPVSAGKLFAAKLAAAVVLGLMLAAGVHGSFLLSQGFQFAQAATGVAKAMVPLGIIAPLCFFLATLTRTVWSFWTWLICLWLGLLFIPAVNPLHLAQRMGAVKEVAHNIVEARVFLRFFLICSAAIVLAALQYRHRRRVVSMVAGALLSFLILAGLEQWRWPLPWLSQPPAPTQVSAWKATPFRGDQQRVPVDQRVHLVSVQITPSNNQAVRFWSADGKAVWEGGSQSDRSHSLSGPTYVGRIAAIQAALGPDIALVHEPDDRDDFIEIPFRSGAGDNLRPMSFDGAIKGERVNLAKLGVIPLLEGAQAVRNGCKLTVDEVPQTGRSRRLSIRYQVPNYKWKDFDPSSIPVVVLVNAVRKEARLLKVRAGRSASANLPGLRVYATAWDFEDKGRNNSGHVTMDDAWLSQAELYAFVESKGSPVSLPVSFKLRAEDLGQ